MLASIQENQCFLAEMMTGNGIYTIEERWRLVTDIDINKLEKAFLQVVQASDRLRSVFYLDDNSVLCRKIENSVDLYQFKGTEFNMLESPLIALKILREETELVFLIRFHHTLMDGWSLGLFLKDLENAYFGRSFSFVQRDDNEGQPPSQKWPNPISNNWMSYNFLHEPSSAISQGVIFSLDEENLCNLQNIANEQSCTLFPLLISKISNVFSKLNNGKVEFEYAIPFSGRSAKNLNSLGMFVETQLLYLNSIEPHYIQKQLLNLIKRPNPLYYYSGMPKIMLNFLDMNVLKLSLSKDLYPLSKLSKYALFDFQVEFRKKKDSLDIFIFGRSGVLDTEMYENIKNDLYMELTCQKK